jgi:hypothetical protein
MVKETHVHTETCLSVFTATIFTVAEKWNHPNVIKDEWLNKMWYIHRLGYYLAIKRSKLLICATTNEP